MNYVEFNIKQCEKKKKNYSLILVGGFSYFSFSYSFIADKCVVLIRRYFVNVVYIEKIILLL